MGLQRKEQGGWAASERDCCLASVASVAEGGVHPRGVWHAQEGRVRMTVERGSIHRDGDAAYPTHMRFNISASFLAPS